MKPDVAAHVGGCREKSSHGAEGPVRQRWFHEVRPVGFPAISNRPMQICRLCGL
jgi:hypothetical protein